MAAGKKNPAHSGVTRVFVVVAKSVSGAADPLWFFFLFSLLRCFYFCFFFFFWCASSGFDVCVQMSN